MLSKCYRTSTNKGPLRTAKTRYDPLRPATTRYDPPIPATTRYGLLFDSSCGSDMVGGLWGEQKHHGWGRMVPIVIFSNVYPQNFRNGPGPVRFARFCSHGSVSRLYAPAQGPAQFRTVRFARFGSHGSKINRKSQIESQSNVWVWDLLFLQACFWDHIRKTR